MIARLLLVLFGILMPLAATAEPGPDQVLADGQVLRGRFTQERHLQGFAAPLRSEGHYVLAPGHGLIWRTDKPFAVTTIITPAGLAQEVNGSSTLNLPASKLPFLSRLYHMLGGAMMGDWHALEENFHVARSGEGKWSLDLTPKRADDPAMPFRSVSIAGERFVEMVTLTKPDGDFDRLTFFDQAISPSPLTADESRAFDALGR